MTDKDWKPATTLFFKGKASEPTHSDNRHTTTTSLKLFILKAGEREREAEDTKRCSMDGRHKASVIDPTLRAFILYLLKAEVSGDKEINKQGGE